MDFGGRANVYCKHMVVLHGTWSTPTFCLWGEETSRKDSLTTAELHAAAEPADDLLVIDQRGEPRIEHIPAAFC